MGRSVDCLRAKPFDLSLQEDQKGNKHYEQGDPVIEQQSVVSSARQKPSNCAGYVLISTVQRLCPAELLID